MLQTEMKVLIEYIQQNTTLYSRNGRIGHLPELADVELQVLRGCCRVVADYCPKTSTKH